MQQNNVEHKSLGGRATQFNEAEGHNKMTQKTQCYSLERCSNTGWNISIINTLSSTKRCKGHNVTRQKI